VTFLSRIPNRAFGILVAALLLAAAIVQGVAYWPGIMMWDAINQYSQAVSGEYADWHPPILQWVWHFFVPVWPGPAPMLLLQQALYWGGIAGIVATQVRAGRRGAALLVGACGLLPIPFALIGAVMKDALMAGALLGACALLAWQQRRWRWRLALPGILLLLFAAALRFNGFIAALPLMVALLPPACRTKGSRLVLSSALCAVPLILAIPVVSGALHARHSSAELSQVIFDLAGITEHSGVDVFPPLAVKDPVAANHHCYTPQQWDPYSWWVPDPCPIQFEAVRDVLHARHASPYVFWLKAVIAHPIAYALHRADHFNLNGRLFVHGRIKSPVFDHDNPNSWNFTFTPNAIEQAIDAAANWSELTPLGWPIWWMAIAAGILILAPASPSRGILLPMALSALAYGLSYAVFSVAAEMRYHFWTMTGTAVAAAILAGDIFAGARFGRTRVTWAVLPLAIVTLLCVGWRAFGSA
jgi:hypothetical protein